MMNRITSLFLIVILVLFSYSQNAQCETYSTLSPDRIEELAQSVLMLEVYDEKDELIATGSGFVAFDSSILITNYQVVDGAYCVVAIGDDGKCYNVNDVCIMDKESDIAILKISGNSNLKPLSVALNPVLRRAETVVAIGSPIGIRNTVSMGNISALYADDGVSLIQFTAPISHGSSGGALINSNGELIGITSGSYADSQNINVAIDSSHIVALYKKWNQRIISLKNYFKGDYVDVEFYNDYFIIQFPKEGIVIEAPNEWSLNVTMVDDGGVQKQYVSLSPIEYVKTRFDIMVSEKGFTPKKEGELYKIGEYTYKRMMLQEEYCAWVCEDINCAFLLLSNYHLDSPAGKEILKKCESVISGLYVEEVE